MTRRDRASRGTMLGFSQREDRLAHGRIAVKFWNKGQWSFLTLYHVLGIFLGCLRYHLALLYARYYLIWCCGISQILRVWCFARGHFRVTSQKSSKEPKNDNKLCSTWVTTFNIYWEQVLRWTFFTLLYDEEEEEEEEEQTHRPLAEQILIIASRRRIAILERRAKRREQRMCCGVERMAHQQGVIKGARGFL